MKKKIVIKVSSTPDNPVTGYADHVFVYDENDKIIGDGHCSTCPNPFRSSDKVPWEEAYGWIALGIYRYLFIYSPKYGKCLLINEGKAVPSRNKNSNHNGQRILTEIIFHVGGFKCKNKDWRGSGGCMTKHENEWKKFIGLFEPGDKGELIIEDFVPLKNEEEPVARKKIFKSKTIWVNLISLVVMIIDRLIGTNVIPTEVGAIGLPIINLILRKLTKDPV